MVDETRLCLAASGQHATTVWLPISALAIATVDADRDWTILCQSSRQSCLVLAGAISTGAWWDSILHACDLHAGLIALAFACLTALTRSVWVVRIRCHAIFFQVAHSFWDVASIATIILLLACHKLLDGEMSWQLPCGHEHPRFHTLGRGESPA